MTDEQDVGRGVLRGGGSVSVLPIIKFTKNVDSLKIIFIDCKNTVGYPVWGISLVSDKFANTPGYCPDTKIPQSVFSQGRPWLNQNTGSNSKAPRHILNNIFLKYNFKKAIYIIKIKTPYSIQNKNVKKQQCK